MAVDSIGDPMSGPACVGNAKVGLKLHLQVHAVLFWKKEK